MRRFPFVLVLLLAPLPAQAADDWVGLTVFSTKDRLPLRNASGDAIGEFPSPARSRATWVIGSRCGTVVHPGPYIGRVKKTDVVKLADAEKFFSEKIKASRKDTWAFRNRATCRRRSTRTTTARSTT